MTVIMTSMVMASCNVTRTITTRSETIQHGDSTIVIQSRTVESYEYDEEDVNHMFEEISKALKDAKAVYANELSRNNKTGFSFK